MNRAILSSTVLLCAAAVLAAAPPPTLFVTGDQCMACHNQLVTPAGEDISMGSDWRASMMAHAARDPYWQASVRRETTVQPGAAAVIENECAKCHMPMARFQAHAAGQQGQVFANLPATSAATAHALLAVDGVSCAMCHQIAAEGLGEAATFSGGFHVDTTTPFGQRLAFGPYEVDQGRTRLMRSAARLEPNQSVHVQSADLCASCHTLFTHTLGPDGEVVGELPEQTPYLEWKHSAYGDAQPCQDCHMPVVPGETAISSVVGQPRTGVSRHVFRGGNFFMPKLLNAHRAALGVAATPTELATASLRTAEHLRTSAATLTLSDLAVEDGRLRGEVAVENLAGHKLPTAYPSRRAWLHLTVRGRGGKVVFESGRLEPTGAIAGNDNDADPSRYEPHYKVLSQAGQVQIWEPILGTPDGEVTTVLLGADRYLKDNRILPLGFDKASAGGDIAVYGRASEDEDFADGVDRVGLDLPLEGEGPYRVEAELWYQPIGFRWAHNLEQQPSEEGAFFVRAYDALAGSSGIVLAVDRAQVE